MNGTFPYIKLCSQQTGATKSCLSEQRRYEHPQLGLGRKKHHTSLLWGLRTPGNKSSLKQ